MAWYILYPRSTSNTKRCKLLKSKPVKPVAGYGFAEGPLATLKDVSNRLNAIGVWSYRRPMRHGRVI